MAIDIDVSHYNTGTATVAASGTAVTGQGTTWVGSIRPGDLFGTHVGCATRILEVVSNTEITLAYPWAGDAQTADPYEIQRTAYDLGYQQAIETLIASFASGNISSLEALAGAANQLPYFTGAETLTLTTLTPFARTLLAAADDAAARTILGV